MSRSALNVNLEHNMIISIVKLNNKIWGLKNDSGKLIKVKLKHLENTQMF